MDINYVKRTDNSLLDELKEIVDLENSRNYIPIYDKFFNLTENNHNTIQLNNQYYLSKILSRINDNVYKSKIKMISNNEEKDSEVFLNFVL